MTYFDKKKKDCKNGNEDTIFDLKCHFCRLTQDIKDVILIKCVSTNKSKISKRKNKVASFVLYGLT